MAFPLSTLPISRSIPSCALHGFAKPRVASGWVCYLPSQGWATDSAKRVSWGCLVGCKPPGKDSIGRPCFGGAVLTSGSALPQQLSETAGASSISLTRGSQGGRSWGAEAGRGGCSPDLLLWVPAGPRETLPSPAAHCPGDLEQVPPTLGEQHLSLEPQNISALQTHPFSSQGSRGCLSRHKETLPRPSRLSPVAQVTSLFSFLTAANAVFQQGPCF